MAEVFHCLIFFFLFFLLLNGFPSWACFGIYCCILGLVAISGRFLFPRSGRSLVVFTNSKKEFKVSEILISIVIFHLYFRGISFLLFYSILFYLFYYLCPNANANRGMIAKYVGRNYDLFARKANNGKEEREKEYRCTVAGSNSQEKKMY